MEREEIIIEEENIYKIKEKLRFVLEDTFPVKKAVESLSKKIADSYNISEDQIHQMSVNNISIVLGDIVIYAVKDPICCLNIWIKNNELTPSESIDELKKRGWRIEVSFFGTHVIPPKEVVNKIINGDPVFLELEKPYNMEANEENDK